MDFLTPFKAKALVLKAAKVKSVEEEANAEMAEIMKNTGRTQNVGKVLTEKCILNIHVIMITVLTILYQFQGTDVCHVFVLRPHTARHTSLD